METDTIEFGVAYPATTQKPPARTEGMVVHELIDVSAYAGTPEGDRYDAAGDDDAKCAAALAHMPNATVTFVEVPEGEDFFVLPPPEFLDHLAELERQESEDHAPEVDVTDPV